MRKSKIGDIVLYHHYGLQYSIWPAIILRVEENNNCYIRIFDDISEDLWTDTVPHADSSQKDHWSWPEEENQCEHDFKSEGFSNHYDYLKCKKCGYKEEKQQCDHAYVMEKGNEDGFLLKCKKCSIIYHIPVYKEKPDNIEEKQEKVCEECGDLPVHICYENKFCSIDCAVSSKYTRQSYIKLCTLVDRIYVLSTSNDIFINPINCLEEINKLIKEWKGKK